MDDAQEYYSKISMDRILWLWILGNLKKIYINIELDMC